MNTARGDGADLDRVLAAVRAQLSWRSRLGYLALLLVAAGGAAALASLWATEPAPLPGRTQAAFAVMILILLAWCAVAGWALVAGARPLYGGDRVVATAVAAVAAAVMTLGCIVLAVSRGGAGSVATIAIASTGLTLTGLALLLHRRARTRHRLLRAHRDALERRLAAKEQAGTA